MSAKRALLSGLFDLLPLGTSWGGLRACSRYWDWRFFWHGRDTAPAKNRGGVTPLPPSHSWRRANTLHPPSRAGRFLRCSFHTFACRTSREDCVTRYRVLLAIILFQQHAAAHPLIRRWRHSGTVDRTQPHCQRQLAAPAPAPSAGHATRGHIPAAALLRYRPITAWTSQARLPRHRLFGVPGCAGPLSRRRPPESCARDLPHTGMTPLRP